MEEYKQKYEQAMLRMNKWVEGSEIIDPKEVAEFVFPELKESEDERIREWLIRLINTAGYRELDTDKMPCSRASVVAWLEKQGEQKPDDKVEPKFKVGDWIASNSGLITGKIIDHTGTWFHYNTPFGIEQPLHQDNICKYHKWSIQDAKDGDVLYIHSFESDCVFLYQNTYEIEPNRNVAVAYCCIDVYANKIEFGIQGPDCIEVGNIKPAAKEQRDLLFQKMKEAGYEWDSEKKELKKIEQKPVWSEEDEKMWSTISDLLWEGFKLSDKKVSWDKIRCWLLPKIKSIKERVQHQPKQDWSEGDEKIFCSLLKALARISSNTRTDSTSINYSFFTEINWLKSLKERVKGE